MDAHGRQAASGIRLYAQGPTPAGALVTGLSAVTPSLRVETDACASGQATLSVRHFTRDGSGLAGPACTTL